MNAEIKHKASLGDLEFRLQSAWEDYLAAAIKEEVEACVGDFLDKELALENVARQVREALRKELGERWLEEEVAGQVERKIKAYRQVIRDKLTEAQQEFDTHVAKWMMSVTDSLCCQTPRQMTLWQQVKQWWTN